MNDEDIRQLVVSILVGLLVAVVFGLGYYLGSTSNDYYVPMPVPAKAGP